MTKKLFLLIFLVLFFSISAFAGLIINPARNELTMERNNVYEGSYLVKSDYSAPVTVDISVKDWNNSPSNKDVRVEDWLVLMQKSVRLAPGEEKEVKYKVYSKNYEGSLSGMVSYTVQSAEHLGINLMTSVPVYLIIEGTQNIDFDFDKLEVINPRMQNPYSNVKTIDILYSVKNSGNIFVRLSGQLKVMKGKKTVVERMIGELSPVYPEQSRGFFEKIEVLPKGKYVLNISLSGRGKTAEKSIQFRVNKYGDVSF